MATLVKQSLLPEFDAMERRVRRMFEGLSLMPAFVSPLATPAADVYETPAEIVVELDVPGYEKQELALELSDHTLTITGSREEVKDENEKAFALHERLERTFERTFVLPSAVDSEHVTAQFEKGVLKIHAPKVELAKQRTIAITT